jgi:acetyltransferase-like isoleucine patch superfamily enzyme
MSYSFKMYKVLLLWRYPGYLMFLATKMIDSFRVRRIRRLRVTLGREVVLTGMPIIVAKAGSSISIGNNVVLCSLSKQTALGVNHPCILRTMQADATLQIGDGCKISGCSICAAKSVTLGQRVFLGANVTIADTDFHSLSVVQRNSPADIEGAVVKPVVIEDDVFIGTNAIILKGVTLGRGSVVGAGSVVTHSCPANSIVAGNPARIVGQVTQ